MVRSVAEGEMKEITLEWVDLARKLQAFMNFAASEATFPPPEQARQTIRVPIAMTYPASFV
jgi:hypothetical protein